MSPSSTAGIEQRRDGFAQKYHRWSLDQWRDEIDTGLPLLRALGNPFAAAVVATMKEVGKHNSRLLANAMVNKAHARVRRLEGRGLQIEENKLLEPLRCRKESLSRENDRRRRRGEATRAAPLARAMENAVAALESISSPSAPFRDGNLIHPAFRHNAAEFDVLTVLVAGHPSRGDLGYYQLIEVPDVQEPLVGRISCLAWLGIASQTMWFCDNDSEVDTAIATLRDCVLRFIDAAPELLSNSV